MNMKLLLVDGSAVLHRAYHAYPPLTTRDGTVVGAVYGVVSILVNALTSIVPTHVVVAWDLPTPTFRHEKYVGYKAPRPKADAEMVTQIPLVKEVIARIPLTQVEQAGYEADDIIGTLVSKIKAKPEIKSIIVTGDLDTLQLVDDDKVVVYTMKKGIKDTIIYNKESVIKRYGLEPKQIVDFKGLKGDSSDNILGVPGIGEKTAIELVKEYGALENIYDNLALIKGKVREKLSRYKKEAFFSRDLSEIRTDVSIGFNLEDCRWADYDKEKAGKMLERFEFQSLINRLP